MIKPALLTVALFCMNSIFSQQILPENLQVVKEDWLIKSTPVKASVYTSSDKKDIILFNGLVQRIFRATPDIACISYTNLTNGQQLIRAVKPEAVITINGIECNVGGIYGQQEKAYLQTAWLDGLKAGENNFRFDRYEVKALKPYLNWKPAGWTMNTKNPTGKLIVFHYSNQLFKEVEVTVNYELYDGLPLIVKYVAINNNSNTAYKINRVKNEILDVVEEESAVVGSPAQMKTPQGIYIETNYAFNNAMRYQISDQTTHWITDSSYTSQVNYNYQTPCVLEVYPDKAPGIELQPNEQFNSVRTYELLMDNYDRERRGLFVRKMYNAVAPWTSSNPIFMHLVSQNDEEVLNAIRQCDSTGYEAIILSFGSHLNMEDTSVENIARWKRMADYAHSKNIRIGGYSLFSSRKISEEDDVINPLTGKTGGAFFGNAPCFGSKWGLAYRDKIKTFFAKTGFDIWENDGPYPGDVCASVTHPGHKGLDDSQWRQMEIQKSIYQWLNERGVYINAPDWYFLDGTHKIAIGYREVNFSLPRDNQKIINRQNIFDGTWEKTPSMGWGFVPLVRYQGGGEEAVLEPLSEHLKDYEQLMMQYYGAGVQACYRGPRLYDTEHTKKKVVEVISWYKKYREILNSDIIHLRRADGRDWDGWMHVNPALQQKALIMLYNPSSKSLSKEIAIPLYYTGLSNNAMVREKEGSPAAYTLERNYTIKLKVTLKANSYSWWVVE